MEWDDELCLCFHVTKRKVWKYLRVQRPRRASQLTGCFGAGTGCGWCRWALRRMFLQWQAEQEGGDALSNESWPDAQQYARLRAVYQQNIGYRPAEGLTAEGPDDAAEGGGDGIREGGTGSGGDPES